MKSLMCRNDLEGGGCNKVSIGERPSGEGGSREKFSFFELFGFLGIRRHFMIIVDVINDYLERVDRVDRILIIIICINRYKLARNHMSIVPDQILLFTNQFPDLGESLSLMRRN